MSSTAELAARAQEIRRQEQLLRQQARELKRKGELDSPRPPTPWMQAVAVRVFALSELDVSVPLEYLRSKGRRAEEAEVRAWHAALPGADREGLLQEQQGQSREARQLVEARKFVAERGLVCWVKRQNTSKSIAPTPGVVLEQFSDVLTADIPRSSQHRRLRRIIARWGGGKGRFSNGGQLSREALEHKAEACC